MAVAKSNAFRVRVRRPATSASLPAWVLALSFNEWYAIPNTSIRSVDPASRPLPETYSGGFPAACSSKIDAWNSLAVNKTGSWLYSAANGGHMDYAGNEVDAIRLNAATPQWAELLTCSTNAPPNVSFYPDGRPTSRHSYASVHYVAAQNRVFLLGTSAGFGEPPPSNRNTIGFNVGNSSWDAQGTWPDHPTSGTVWPATMMAQHPTTDDVYISFPNTGAFVRFNAATGTYTTIVGSSTADGSEGCAVIDPVRGRFVHLNTAGSAGRNLVRSLTTGAVTPVTLIGSAASLVDTGGSGSGQSHGMIYEPDLDRYVVKTTGHSTRLISVNPTTWDCTEITTTLRAGSAAPSVPSLGVYQRFRYIPELRGVAYVPSGLSGAAGNVYFLRTAIAGLGETQSVTLNPVAVMVPRAILFDSGTYERYVHVAIAENNTWVFEWRNFDHNVGLRPFRTTPYKLYVDDVLHDTVSVSPGAGVGQITVRASELTHGWHVLKVVGEADETAIPAFLFVKRPGGTDPAFLPVFMGSHECEQGTGFTRYSWVWVPVAGQPSAYPLAAYTATPFSTALPRTQLYMHEYVPWERSWSVDVYRPRVTNGVVNTCNGQGYLFTPVIQQIPNKALLDGPRGVASIGGGITHMEWGINRQDTIYVAEAWRICHVTGDGWIRTIAGLRSRTPPGRSNPPSAADYDLIGDWSAIPANRRGFHELWGLTWRDSTVMNVSGPPIPNDGIGLGGVLQQPHTVGPELFVSDTQNNRVLKLKFSPTAHLTPVVVTEFITGMSDPWDIRSVGDVLYVSERTLNRITKWSAVDGSFLGTLIQGPTDLSYAALDPNGSRVPVRLQSLAAVRAQGCVLPEGLYILDGFLYFSSFAMAQVRKVDLNTGVATTVVDLDPNTHLSGGAYTKIALSDGTFGPRGSIFLGAWGSGNTAGLPWAWLPDGTAWNYYTQGGDVSGPGLPWHGLGYTGVAAVKNGRLAVSSSIAGIGVIVKSSGQFTYGWDTHYAPAALRWFQLGLHLAHGHDGRGYFGLPKPWGRETLIDNYLTMYGHTQ